MEGNPFTQFLQRIKLQARVDFFLLLPSNISALAFLFFLVSGIAVKRLGPESGGERSCFHFPRDRQWGLFERRVQHEEDDSRRHYRWQGTVCGIESQLQSLVEEQFSGGTFANASRPPSFASALWSG